MYDKNTKVSQSHYLYSSGTYTKIWLKSWQNLSNVPYSSFFCNWRFCLIILRSDTSQTWGKCLAYFLSFWWLACGFDFVKHCPGIPFKNTSLSSEKYPSTASFYLVIDKNTVINDRSTSDLRYFVGVR